MIMIDLMMIEWEQDSDIMMMLWWWTDAQLKYSAIITIYTCWLLQTTTKNVFESSFWIFSFSNGVAGQEEEVHLHKMTNTFVGGVALTIGRALDGFHVCHMFLCVCVCEGGGVIPNQCNEIQPKVTHVGVGWKVHIAYFRFAFWSRESIHFCD